MEISELLPKNPVWSKIPQLLEHHYQQLIQGSGLSDEVIQARGYRSIFGSMADIEHLTSLGFSKAQRRVPGLLIPLYGIDGKPAGCQFRPDDPRINSKGKPIKYENPVNSKIRLDCPPLCLPHLADPKVPLFFTEGVKKADSLASRGCCVIALTGVWGFKGKNSFGGITLLADFDSIALEGREGCIVYDSDSATNPQVRKAQERLAEHLHRKGVNVKIIYLPANEDGSKNGVDDYLVKGHSIFDLTSLSVPYQKTGEKKEDSQLSSVELLDYGPEILRRPLALINGQSYAATWAWVRETRAKSTNTQKLFVIRKDGRIFGKGGDAPLEELGIEVGLPEIPLQNRLWSAQGIKRYRKGERPNPIEVFRRIVEIVDRFIDFGSSLADQRTMAEFIAGYIMGTYFLEAFNVVGYLWPNGDRGVGKTHLLTITCELAYLGQVILSGGSYPALRDLADYGATLGFDDAEKIMDTKHFDPEKRSLLLAGNRRGSTVPLKELVGGKTWKTRYVNTFCPRLFTAIHLPDPVLASRTIIIPLVRTSNIKKANADPLDYSLWPHNRQRLVDDLWALGLEHLDNFPSFDRKAADLARLSGRNLEPWRIVHAVALWLEEHGENGLFARMENLSVSYQSERRDFEANDLTRLTINSLYDLVREKRPNSDKDLIFTTADLTGRINTLAEQEELTENGKIFTNSKQVGIALGQHLRLKKPNYSGGSREWIISKPKVEGLRIAYGLVIPPADDPLRDRNNLNGLKSSQSSKSSESSAGGGCGSETSDFSVNLAEEVKTVIGEPRNWEKIMEFIGSVDPSLTMEFKKVSENLAGQNQELSKGRISLEELRKQFDVWKSLVFKIRGVYEGDEGIRLLLASEEKQI